MPKYSKLPVYEMEFLPAERRLSERCGPLQRLNELIASDESRTSPGRRDDDWKACYAQDFPNSSWERDAKSLPVDQTNSDT